jgi:cytochrome oxidase assembly protein ShyY1
VQGIDISPQVGGVVRAINFESGQDVQRGQLLIQIDDSVEQADLKSNLATLRNVELALERQRQLVAGGSTATANVDSALAARDSPAQRQFFTFDTAAIGAALGITPAPFGLTVVGAGPARSEGGFGASPAPHRGALPDPARGFPAPRNPHLGYAVTWFGLAIAWVVIFSLWGWRRVRA